MSGISRLRLLTLAATLAFLFAATGCASVGDYFEHRYRDFTRMIDLGITVSKKPQFGLYVNSLEIITAGYSNVDGYFIGWGGGQIGVTRMYNHCWALAYGEETIGWGSLLDTDRREEAIVRRRSGVLGIASNVVGVDPTGNGYGNGPDYTPSCVHFFPHLLPEDRTRIASLLKGRPHEGRHAAIGRARQLARGASASRPGD
jgi:hypothetical protein